MDPVINSDIRSVSIELNELKSKFDESMSRGEDFSQLKKIYLLIKDAEYRLHTLQCGGTNDG
jgi:hypothetical protein